MTGMYSFSVVSLIWEAGFSTFHANRTSSLENCSDPFADAPLIWCAAAEALGTFALTVASALIADSGTDPVVGALLFASIVVLGSWH